MEVFPIFLSGYSEDDVMLASLDAGADDVLHQENTYEITMKSENLIHVKEALEAIGVKEFLTSEVTYLPINTVEVDDETKEKVENLVEALEDIDDVNEVYYNLKETQ